MKARPFCLGRLIVPLGLISVSASVHAADGSWTNPAGGLWSDSGNWNGAAIADGGGSTANFNTLDLTADNTIQLDSARTIGNLIFGDTAVATAGSWILNNKGSGSNILTLGVASGTPTITVNALGTSKVAAISLELAGTQGVTKAGTGELQLNGVNTYSGTTAVSAGPLRLQGVSGTGGTILNSTGVAIAAGATLALTNDLTNGNSPNRVADGAAITLNGGTFNFGSSTAAATVFSETVGQLNIANGNSRVVTSAASGAGSSSTLTFASLNRSAGTNLTFATTTTLGGTSNKIIFISAPTVDVGGLIGGWATAGSQDFAAYGANGVVVAISTATNAVEAGWATGQNVKITTAQTLTADRAINALSVVSPTASTVLNLGGFTLRVESGGILTSQSSNSNPSLTNGNLTAGVGAGTNAELFLSNSQGSTGRFATISANIVDNGAGVVSLVANSGVNGASGDLVISGANTYTGTTTITGTIGTNGAGVVLGSSTAINNSKTLTVAAGGVLNMGGFTATVDALLGGGALDARTTSATASSGSTISIGNSNGSGIFAGSFNVAGSSTRNMIVIKNGTGTQVFAGSDFRDVTAASGSSTTTINNGTLQFAKQASLYNNNPAKWLANNIIVNNGATLALNVGGTGEFTSANVDIIKALGTATGGFQSGSKLALDTTNGGANFSYATAIADTNGGANSIGLTKLGNGTLELSGANTYTGATTVSAGTLLVSGSLGATAITVSGGTLGGNGSIGGAVTVDGGGFVSPGASIGTQSLASLVLLGTLIAEYDGSGAGSIDMLNVTAALDITNATVNFQQLGSALDDGAYVFASYGSLDGSRFANSNTPTGYEINYVYNGNNIALVAIPEPSAAWLGAIGLLALARRKR